MTTMTSRKRTAMIWKKIESPTTMMKSLSFTNLAVLVAELRQGEGNIKNLLAMWTRCLT